MTEDLATAAARLAEVLAAENAALAAMDLPRAGAMLAEKTRATIAFVAAEQASHGNISTVGAATQVRLRTLAAENQRLLQQAMTVQGRVIGIIARAVSRSLRDPLATRYGAQGRAASTRLSAVAISARA
jgi:hypothetical protein